MFKKYMHWVPIIAIVWAMFQLYLAAIGPMIAQLQRAMHIALALALTFLLKRRGQDSKIGLFRYFDYVLAICALTTGIYIYSQAERLTSRIQFVSELSLPDYAVAIAVTVLVLEAARRTVGYAMTVLAAFFLVYAFTGPYFPGLLQHSGIAFKNMTEIMYFSLDGILGVPIGVSVDYVFYFILFAAFLDKSGGGKLFIDLAFKLTRRSKGGPAKAAILASGGMGSISGSAVGNVASTGVFTIPLMKKVGYTPMFAASVEALASTGGQMLPPIMGAAAFIMADTIGIPYAQVALAAIIPAVLFYVVLYFTVHFEASKKFIDNYINHEANQAPEKKESVLGRLHLLAPMVILIYFIFSGKSIQLAAFWAIIATIVFSFLRKSTRMTITDIFDALVEGTQRAIQVAIPCAVAGIIVGVISHSGLGLKFSSMIVDYSFGIPLLSVIVVALGSMVLGMGMPTTSAYIMGAVLLAPSLVNLGFEVIASHMFVLYLSCLSMITPPVALAAYAAASIAQCNANRTGFVSFYLCIPGFVIPFAFVFNPSLLLVGELSEIVWMTVRLTLALVAIAGALIGFMVIHLNLMQRILLAVAALMLIVPGQIVHITGILLLLILFFLQFLSKRKGSKMAVGA